MSTSMKLPSSMRARDQYYLGYTGRDKHLQLLHHIGKVDGPDCPRGSPPQDGEHLVWNCSIHNADRRQFLEGHKCWEGLDRSA